MVDRRHRACTGGCYSASDSIGGRRMMHLLRVFTLSLLAMALSATSMAQDSSYIMRAGKWSAIIRCGRC
jgi:hypothetical protein